MATMDFDDLMASALDEARRARDAGEVPIGAVVALDGAIIGRGFNQPISSGDPTAHAAMIAIRAAAGAVGNYRLTGAILCVTIEPCLMCVGALVHARIGTLVYGAAEPRTGAVTSTVRGGELPGHNHRFAVVAGVREDECRALIQTFFTEPRAATRAPSGCRRGAFGIMQGPSCSRPAGPGARAYTPRRRGTEVVVTGAPRKRL